MLLVLESLGLMVMQLSFQLLYLHGMLIDGRSGAAAMRLMVFSSLTYLRILLSSQVLQLRDMRFDRLVLLLRELGACGFLLLGKSISLVFLFLVEAIDFICQLLVQLVGNLVQLFGELMLD